MEKKEKQRGVCTMRRGRTGDSRIVRNSLLPPKSMVRSWPVLPPRAMSPSMALQQQEFVTTKGEVEVPGLGCHQEAGSWPHPHLGIMGKLALEA